MTVSDEEAMQTARRLAALEGIPGGISSGAALACAMRLAAREQMEGKTVIARSFYAANRSFRSPDLRATCLISGLPAGASDLPNVRMVHRPVLARLYGQRNSRC